MGRSRRGRVKRGLVAKKLDRQYIATLGVTKKPTLDYSWRRGAEVNAIKSLPPGTAVCATTSVMDPVALQRESPEVRAAIVAKSQRVAIAYNKGAYQYVTDETDTTSLGRKAPA